MVGHMKENGRRRDRKIDFNSCASLNNVGKIVEFLLRRLLRL